MEKDTKELKEKKGPAIPDKYKPMNAWAFWWWSIIYSFPIVGFVYIIINSIRGDNLSRRSHARSYLLWFFINLILITATILILYFTGVIDKLIAYLDDLVRMPQ